MLQSAVLLFCGWEKTCFLQTFYDENNFQLGSPHKHHEQNKNKQKSLMHNRAAPSGVI